MKIARLLSLCLAFVAQHALVAQTAAHETTASASASYGKLPLAFEANQGQTDSQVRFTARGSRYSLFLTGTEAVLALPAQSSPSKAGDPASARTRVEDVLRLKLAGAQPAPHISGVDQLAGIVNYFSGSDPAKWHTHVPTYSKVKYVGVYPGIDLLYYGNEGRLEYDFVVAPHADASAVRLSVSGARKLSINKRGELIVATAHGSVSFLTPKVYQQKDSQQIPVEGRYLLSANNDVSFALGSYDHDRPLVIDPVVLTYSTYLGGSQGQYFAAVAVDAQGDAYVTGTDPSFDFPVTPGAYQTQIPPNYDAAFVTRFDPTGSHLIYSTYLNGAQPYSLAVDKTGSAYITGSASTDLPITANAFQKTAIQDGGEAFVTKLSSDGSTLAYSTFLGGSAGAFGRGIAVDVAGHAYVCGMTSSYDFPVTVGAYEQTDRAQRVPTGFVTKFSLDGSSLVYSTYLGGSYEDHALALTVGPDNSAYVTGLVTSFDFPITPGAYQTGGIGGVFVTKLAPDGASLRYSSRFGGTGYISDQATSIAIDAIGNSYIAGYTFSSDFPVTPNAFQSVLADKNPSTENLDTFLTELNSTGSALVYSTYLGGTGNDFGDAVAVDANRNIFVAGKTFAPNFPLTSDAYQTVNSQVSPFLAQFGPDGSSLRYSTLFGSSDPSGLTGMALDASGNAYLAGTTDSSTFPVTPNAFQLVNKGSATLFISKLTVTNVATAATPAISPAGGVFSTAQTLNITDSSPGAVIHYTTDGSQPTATSPIWAGSPISIVSPQTVKAIATSGGLATSLVASATFSFEPIISPSSGTFSAPQTLTINVVTPNAIIYYTTDGTTPTTASAVWAGHPITIDSSQNVQAIAVTGSAPPSPVSSATFLFVQPVAPVVTPNGGTFNTPQTLTITDATSGAVIHYTTDGTTPTISSPVWAGTPMSISTSQVIQAIAVLGPMEISPIASAAFTFLSPTSHTIDYSNGFSAGNLSFNGSAALKGTRLELTSGAQGQAGSSFYTTPVNIQTFDTDFTFQLSAATADGFAFVLQNRGPQALGAAGGNLGLLGGYYGGQTAVGITFGLYAPDSNQINIYQVSNFQYQKIGPVLDLTPSGIDLHSGRPFKVHLSYDGTFMKLVITDTVTGVFVVHNQEFGTLNLPSMLGANTAYVGFSGADGYYTATQDITNWTYTVPALTLPASPVFSGVAPPGGVTSFLTISDTDPTAVIHYTQDGTAVSNKSLIYTGPVAILGPQTVNAVAITPSATSLVSSIQVYDEPTLFLDHDFGPGVVTLNGSASFSTGLNYDTYLRLTDGKQFEAGSAFYPVIEDASNFSSVFTFQETQAAADGFMFVVQGQTPYALGGAGGDLGYGGNMKDSIGIKFDLFNNAGEGINSTGLYINGQMPTVPSIDLTPFGIDFHSGDIFNVQITGNPSTITVVITDTVSGATAAQVYPVTSTTPVIGKEKAYFGFTGGTGGLTTIQDIQSWYLTIGTPLPAQSTSSNARKAPATHARSKAVRLQSEPM